MKQKTASVVLATALGLGGLTTGVVLAPAMASAATTQTSPAAAVGDRLTTLKDALKGLVTDGTLTQEQADEVATTLDSTLPKRGHGGGHRGFGHGLAAATATLGVTPQELRTALESGKSLADVAAEKGVAKEALITALVDEAKAHLAEKVTEGRLTQAQADARAAEITERVTAMVDRKGLPLRGGKGGRGLPGVTPPAEAATPAPSPTS